MQEGKINVQTENIFPIIKKFLYSDHEIFLRELVSNAVDATQKLKTLASMGKVKDELGDLTIQVIADKEAKTLTIRDRGIGMTAEEIDKYINQIAFSGAEEFVNKFKNKSEAEQNAIIGHFGLGFYSSFMVSDKVEIFSKTYKKGGSTKAVRWECDGSPNYTIEETDKTERGTDIVLHISDEEKEFLEESKILELLNKYSKFLPVPIQFGKEKKQEKVEGEKDKDGNDVYKEVETDRIINNSDPIWKKAPAELKDEEYKNFYHELYPMNFEEPLFHIHLNVDYPFNLTGVLYFPKLKKNLEVQKDKIQLYSNQVFVTDSVEGIVPEFLTLLHGVIDSPDIPLNVSRSYLQSDRNVKKISNHITKKVADKLEEIFKNNREELEAKWDDIKVFIEYGMISDEKFSEKAMKFALLKNTDGKHYTFEEYNTQVKETQKDKDNKVVYLYSTDKDEQYSYIQAAKDRGYDVLEMDGVLDNHFINTLEQKLTDVQFKRVDADTIEKLIDKDEKLPSKLDEKQQEVLKPVIEKNIDKAKFTVVFESLSETESPIIITQSEFMRRMKDMEKLGGGGMMGLGGFPETYNLVVNSNHPLVTEVLEEKEEEVQQAKVKQMYDLALLSQSLLKGKELADFIKRSFSLIK
ncbi:MULTISPECIES: molecular chaperone HtpG [unclassified Lentimicrobium]|uniref:molecular chaperone HtpG n=1 Tax=unclassified Lentimicrobium TaxID=2677434 RepID=UPI001557A77F|nr:MULTISPECIES: molecular chaperone HtpG [unclassified Lentimicrobium]NPD44827.1 molecular chaperone HtpG [Lentimicrobium sp. S6]NPD83156.1 molecular chaperone HtpG [Lentimicrobium sp. L6]